MNKKTYCTPAITVAQGVLQPVLAAVSGELSPKTLKFDTDAQDNTIEDATKWEETDNATDDKWNF